MGMLGPRDPDDEESYEAGQDEEGEGADAGLLDDESGDEAEAGQEPEDDEGEEGLGEEQPKKLGRAEKAVLAAKREAREARERTDRLERELNELRAERLKAQAQGETPEQEAAKLSLMTPEERMDYKLAKAEAKHERQMNLVRFESADRADKAAYDARASVDPKYKKYAAEVERVLLTERKAGRNFPRETILKFVIGDKVLSNQGSTRKQQQQGKARVARQQARPGDAGSDRAATRGRAGGNDLYSRLENVEI